MAEIKFTKIEMRIALGEMTLKIIDNKDRFDYRNMIDEVYDELILKTIAK
jgi:methyl coenzyme M reductase subunit D